MGSMILSGPIQAEYAACEFQRNFETPVDSGDSVAILFDPLYLEVLLTRMRCDLNLIDTGRNNGMKLIT